MTQYVLTQAVIILIAVTLALPVAAAAEVVVHTENGVSYVSGGVGDEELKALNAMSARFNLKLTLALKTGEFVSDATVRIQDSHRETVVDTVADGPVLFAQLKPGSYTVTCTLGGKELQQTAHVTDRTQQHLLFSWSTE